FDERGFIGLDGVEAKVHGHNGSRIVVNGLRLVGHDTVGHEPLDNFNSGDVGEFSKFGHCDGAGNWESLRAGRGSLGHSTIPPSVGRVAENERNASTSS